MKKELSILLLLLFFVGAKSYSQTDTLRGNVVAFKGFGLNNITVYAKKSKQTTLSDSLGNYEILCNNKDVIRFSGAGLYAESIKVKNKKELSINLIYIDQGSAYKDLLKNEHLSKETLDHCVENLMDENNNYDRMSSIYEIIQKEYGAANIANVEGSTQVILNSRGPNSLESGSQALLVVDGIVTEDISGISPLQVRAVKVLVGNDAAHWGVRGANGVVEIELKSGI